MRESCRRQTTFGKIAKLVLNFLRITEEDGMTNPKFSQVTIAEAVVRRDGIIFADRTMLDRSNNYYANIKYESRELFPFSTTARESIYYYRYIDQLLRKVSPAGLILDVGCGDGRVTRRLLKSGHGSIIASDIDYDNLKTLEQSLSPAEQERVLLLQGDVAKLPLQANSLDAILAIGVLNVMREQFVDTCQSLHRLLKPGGLLINSEPTLDGALLYALVRHDAAEFIKVMETKTKAIDYDGDKSKRYAVFEAGEVESLLGQSGFKLEEMMGIPVYPSLMFGGMLREIGATDAVKASLASACDRFMSVATTSNRVIMYCSRKAGAV